MFDTTDDKFVVSGDSGDFCEKISMVPFFQNMVNKKEKHGLISQVTEC